jgi:hypothetical protein
LHREAFDASRRSCTAAKNKAVIPAKAEIHFDFVFCSHLLGGGWMSGSFQTETLRKAA